MSKSTLALNLRTISQYNFEQLKEKLRGYTRSVFDSVDAVTTQCQPLLDQKIPAVRPIQQTHSSKTSNEELDREIFLLEREIVRELEQTEELRGEVQVRIGEMAQCDTQVSAEVVSRQLQALEEAEKWLDEKAAAAAAGGDGGGGD